MMTTTTNTIAMLHNLVFSAPISRMVVRRYSLSTTAAAAAISTTATTAVNPPKPVRAPHVDSQVLLGMSEPELQQLAIKLGQVKKDRTFFFSFYLKRIQLYELGTKKVSDFLG